MASGVTAAAPPQTPAWLVSRSGDPNQVCFPISNDRTTVGRAPDNDVVIPSPKSVSLHHLVIERVTLDGQDAFRVRDLSSTNGTFVNGTRVTESVIGPGTPIRLGSQGPELWLVIEDPAAWGLDRTTVILAGDLPAMREDRRPNNTYEEMLSEGVKRLRQARSQGLAGHTMTIMREALKPALKHMSRRFRISVGLLVIAVVGVSGGAAWKIVRLNQQKSAIDRQITQLEAQVQKAGSTGEANRLIAQLEGYEAAGGQLQGDPLYRFGRREQDPVTIGIRGLMAEFGAEEYSVPPEFRERVEYYIRQYQGPYRPLMTRALYTESKQISVVQQVLEQQHLPPDLSYLPLVESALESLSHSRAGAVGLWQLTPVTARAYGLRVSHENDERLDTLKATRAACQYLHDLILGFGAGSSVMLALAAYDLGPAKVKQAIAEVVADPIKQRNFWYLYRVKALPVETREYVPKVFAAMIIARDPGRFGF
jgi:pSer/pThr/pTyr-binding forkhead associated (FHA) protein